MSDTDRLDGLRRAMRRESVDAAIFGPSADFSYFTGHRLKPTERLTALIVTEDDALVVTPRLQAAVFDGLENQYRILIWDETQQPVSLIAETVRGAAGTVALNGDLWATFALELGAALPDTTFITSGRLTSPLRAVKSEEEQTALREASSRIDCVWRGFVRDAALVGRTENDISREIRSRMIEQGFEEIAWCDVGAGANGASPLHHGSDRVIEPGEPVVIDFAGSLGGYFADICRTPVAGTVAPDVAAAYEVVLKAQETAFQSCHPGVPCEKVDKAARQVIAAAGFGDYFIHRLGHGIGLDAHEVPYIIAGNDQPLVEGMAFSDEPGIYLPNRWGIRIEDLILITPSGPERLNTVPRELTVMA